MYTRTIKNSPKTGKVTLKDARSAAKAAKSKKKSSHAGKALHKKKDDEL